MTAQAPTPTPTQEQIRGAWDAIAPGFDEFVTPKTMQIGEEMVRRAEVRPGVRFLDVAAGSGGVGILAARSGAQVVATDIAPKMIERLTARARAEGLSNLEGRVMDGTALEFADDTFDVSASLNGVSLFPDLDRGLAELVRVTRPGGRVLIGTFGAPQKAEFLTFFIRAIQATLPGFPSPLDPPPLPFQVSDPDVLQGRLTGAGLSDARVDTVTWKLEVESADRYWNMFTSSNPIGAQLAAKLTAEQQAEVQRVLSGMLRERSGAAATALLHSEVSIGIGTK